MTCCLVCSFKTLLTSTERKPRQAMSRVSFPLAGFQVTLYGRFWVTPEDEQGQGIWRRYCVRNATLYLRQLLNWDPSVIRFLINSLAAIGDAESISILATVVEDPTHGRTALDAIEAIQRPLLPTCVSAEV
jgi:hypothetical protein